LGRHTTLNKFRELATCLQGFASPRALIRKTLVPLPLRAFVLNYSPLNSEITSASFSLLGFPEWCLAGNFCELRLRLDIIFCFLKAEAVEVFVLWVLTPWSFVELQRFRKNILLPYFYTLNVEALHSYELLVTTCQSNVLTTQSNVCNHIPV
jgi:hypothetical protein